MGVSSQLHPLAKEFGDGSQRYPLIRRLDGLQRRSGHSKLRKISYHFQESNTSSVVAQPAA